MEVVFKIKEETDPRYGKRPEERTIEELLRLGIIVVDKPRGPSSHEVSSWVRRIISAKKAGHSGTLDPKVSGVLPVGINEATKALGFLLKSDKEYIGIMKIHRKVPEEKVRNAFEKFTGEIIQVPPVRSAVRRRARKRKVYYLVPLEYINSEVLFVVRCEAGTYVRKLCSDIGDYLGCGAHMLELRRTKVGVLSEEMAVTLQELSDAVWLWEERGCEGHLRKAVRPVEDAVSLRRIWLRDSAVEAVCSGAQLAVPGISKIEKGVERGEMVALMTLKNELVAIGRAEMSTKEMLEAEKGLATKTIRVIMRKGTYPKGWKKNE